MANNQLQEQKDVREKSVVEVVQDKVRSFQNNRQLDLPPDYSPENALKSAWLELQEAKDKNGKPALEVCTKSSIANALLDMVVQGLNPSKKQCYFIVYGNQLVCQRSYFGTMALTKRVESVKDIYAAVVYKGDEFEYELNKGKVQNVQHKQKLENVSNDNIQAAYCTIEFQDGKEFTEIMTIDQIKQAWQQGQVYKGKSGGGLVHDKFTDQMAMKTVINRACKKFINSSSDSHLFLESVNRADEITAEAQINEEAEEYGNVELIDVEPEEPAEEQGQPPHEPPQEEAPEPAEFEASQKGQQQAISQEGPGF